MRKIKFISILLVLSMLLTVPAFAFSTGFTDVSEKATYAESVSYLADASILRGTASGRFAPNEKITVSQWATMLCRAFATEPEGVSWQEVGANAVQIAIRSGWLEPTAISDANGLICRGELYRTAFSATGIPLYDATLYGIDWLSSGENALRVGKELGLCAENKTAADLITRAEAAQLLHAVLTQTLTVVTPDTPITVENLTQWNVNTFLLELRKVPQPILDAFNENGWTFVIGTEYLTELSRKLGVNCIGAAVYTEKQIYVSEASAVLHEFGHFLDCAMGFPQEHKEDGFLKSFTAGFLTTCGLTAVGSPCVDEGEELPLHGTIGNTPCDRLWWEETDSEIIIHAEIADRRIFSRKLLLRRTIICCKEENRITISDTVENQGDTDSTVMLLYHMNMGYPLLSEHAVVKINSGTVWLHDP